MNENRKISTQVDTANVGSQTKKLDILSDIAARQQQSRKKRGSKRIFIILIILMGLASLAFSLMFIFSEKTYKVSFYVNSQYVRTIDILEGEKLTEGDIPLIRNNIGSHAFVGWYSNHTGTGEKFSFEKTSINNNLTLYAVYRPQVVTLRVILNDGTSNQYEITGDYAQMVSVLDQDFLDRNLSQEYKTSYQLLGFDRNNDVSTPQYSKLDKVNLFSGEVYAIWQGVEVAVELSGNNARNFDETAFETRYLGLRYGDQYQFRSVNFENVYQQGTGASPNGFIVKYADGREEKRLEGTPFTIETGMSLRLNFGDEKHILTLVYNNGMPSETYYGNRRVLLPSNITYEHHALDGYEGPMGKVLAGEVTISGEVMYSAIWEGVFYNIYLHSDGADYEGTEVIYQKYGEGYYTENTKLSNELYTIAVPKKTGYNFLGYFTEENGEGVQVINDEGEVVDQSFNLFTEHSTIYAYYESVVLNVEFENSISGEILVLEQEPISEEDERYSVVYGRSLRITVELYEQYTKSYARIVQSFTEFQHPYVRLITAGSVEQPAILEFYNITTDLVIVLPVFNENEYLVKWKNWNGELLTQESYKHNEVPQLQYTPFRPGSSEVAYRFAGWLPEVTTVTKDITYNATFDTMVTRPTELSSEIYYTGYEQSIYINKSFYTVASEGRTLVGGPYYATATLKDASYFWDDGSKSPFNLSWEILPISVAQPSTQGEISFTYSGDTHNFEAMLTPLNKDYVNVIGRTSAIDAGTYSVTVYLKDDNYVWQTWQDNDREVLYFEWSIKKIDVIVKAFDKEVSYTGVPITLNGNPATTTDLSFQGFRPGDSPTDNIDGYFEVTTNPENVVDTGIYEIIIEIGTAQSNNYNIIIQNGATIVVKENYITKPRLESTSFDYKASEITPVIAYYNPETMEILEGSVLSATDANIEDEVYTIYVKPKENNIWGEDFTSDVIHLTWKINKAEIPVYANNTTVVYGTQPDFSVSYNLLGGDTAQSAITGEFAFSGPAINATDAGTYSLIAELGSVESTNYNFKFYDGTLTIINEKINLPSIGFNTFEYSSKEITAPILDFDEGTMQILEGSVLNATDAGSYFVKIAPKKNYEWITGNDSEQEFSWYITKALLTVNVNDVIITYGDDIPNLTYNITGWIEDDESKPNMIIGEFELSTDATSNSPASTYEILISLGGGTDIVSSKNYNFDLLSGSLTIIERSLTIPTLVKSDYVYNASEINMMLNLLNYNADGMIVEGNIAEKNVGNYEILISLKNNYQWIGGGHGTIILPWYISAVPLTVSLQNKAITYQDNIPNFDIVYSGFIYPDNEYNAFTSGSFIATTQANANSPAGEYDIYFANVGVSNNYDITIETATLTIAHKSVVRPTLANDEFVYSGLNIVPVISNFIDDENVMNIEAGSVINAKDANSTDEYYSITISLASDSYKWASDGSEHQTLTWTIKQTELIIKASDISFHYGDNIELNSPQNVTYTGFKPGDNAQNSITASFTLETDAEAGSPIGDYDIVFANTSFSATNYYVTWQSGKLYILEKDNIFKPELIYSTFQYTNKVITPAIFGFDANTMEIQEGSVTSATNATGENPDYKIFIKLKDGYRWQDEEVGETPSIVRLEWKITKVDLYVFVNDKSFVYDDIFPTFSGVPTSADLRYENFIGTDNAANSITGNFTIQPEDGLHSKSDIGFYTIYLSKGNASAINYNIIVQGGNGTLSILAKSIKEPTLQQPTFVYSALPYQPHILDFDTTAFDAEGDLIQTNVGKYAITFVLKPNHIWERGGTADIVREWQIEKAPLSIKVNDITIIYGETIPSFSGNPQTSSNVSYYGFLESDTKSVIHGSFVITTSANANSPAASYNIAIDASGASADNYNLYPINGTLTIAERMVAKPYLQRAVFDYTASDITPTIINFNSEYMEHEAGSQITEKNASPQYTITINLKDNYTWEGSRRVVLHWQINKVSLIVKANNKSMIHGATPPAFNGHTTSADLSFQGFKGDDGRSTGAVTGAFSLSCNVTSSTPPGTYPIILGRGSANSLNYNIIIDGGNADLTILLNTTDIKPTLSNNSFEYTAGVISPHVNNFDASTMIMSGSTSATEADTYTITVSLRSGYTWGDGTTNAVYLNWEITKAMLIIKADDQSRPFNTENQTPTYTVTGILGDHSPGSQIEGDFILNHTATTNSPIGDYTITITSVAQSNNYDFTLLTGTLNIYKHVLTKPTVSITEFTYNGIDIPLNLSNFDSQTMNVTGNVYKNVGNYTATISLIDNVNYVWADDTINSYSINWEITKATLLITARDRTKVYLDSVPAFNNDPKTSLDLVYFGFQGSDNEINSIDGLYNISSPVVASSSVGTYAITLQAGTATSHNYNLQLENGTYSVTVIYLPKPAVSATTYTFDNVEKTLNFPLFNNELMNVSGHIQTNAGSYTATITLKDTDNYKWEDGTFAPEYYSWIINKRVLNKPTISNPTLVFIADYQQPEIEESYYYMIRENSQAESGQYEATITLQFNDTVENVIWFDNTSTQLKLPWEIIPYTPTLNPQQGTYEYIWGELLNSKEITETVLGVNYDIPGTFTFVNPTYKPPLYTTSVQIRFTPASANNYTTEIFMLEISVRQVGIYFQSNGGSIVNTILGEYDRLYSEPSQPIRTGYTFKGWYKDNNTFNEGVVWAYRLVEDITFYAKWEINTYIVSFSTSSSNGTASVEFPNNITIESGHFASQERDYNQSYIINLNAMPFTKDGYRLYQSSTGRSVIGVQINGTGTIYTSSVVITGNTTLTFAFNPVADILTVNYNAGSVSGTGTAQANSVFRGKGTNLNVVAVKKEFYILLGYYHQNISWAVASEYALLSYSQLDSRSVDEGSITYYAIWEPIMVNFTYSSNGGTGSSSGGTGAKYGTTNFALASRNTIARTYYSYKGWAKSGAGPVAHVAGAVININSALLKDSTYQKSNYTIGDLFITITLYANWERNQTIINFNYNGGSGSPLNVTILSGEYINNITTDSRFRPTTANRTNYDFDGWSTSSGGSILTGGWTVPDVRDYTLYAQWSPVVTEITFDKRGGSGGSNSVIAIYNSAMPSANAPSRSNYDFTGYYDSPSGGVQYYRSNMTSARNWNQIISSYTLYAQWDIQYVTCSVSTCREVHRADESCPNSNRCACEGGKYHLSSSYTTSSYCSDCGNADESRCRNCGTYRSEGSHGDGVCYCSHPSYRTSSTCSRCGDADREECRSCGESRSVGSHGSGRCSCRHFNIEYSYCSYCKEKSWSYCGECGTNESIGSHGKGVCVDDDPPLYYCDVCNKYYGDGRNEWCYPPDGSPPSLHMY